MRFRTSGGASSSGSGNKGKGGKSKSKHSGKNSRNNKSKKPQYSGKGSRFRQDRDRSKDRDDSRDRSAKKEDKAGGKPKGEQPDTFMMLWQQNQFMPEAVKAVAGSGLDINLAINAATLPTPGRISNCLPALISGF